MITDKEQTPDMTPPDHGPTTDNQHNVTQHTEHNTETNPEPQKKKESSPEDDIEATELSKLRCGSLCTEELAEREKQKQQRRNRQNRCADYPGFAFGSAMFGSDTMMKFNIIKNELHNIMRSQLKRVDGEVNALSSRVKQLDKNLEESEHFIKTATSTLAEAVAIQIEESKNCKSTEENNPLSAFDQQVAFLEGQLKEAKVRSRQSFQILEDCDRAQELIIAAGSREFPATFAAGSPQVPATYTLDNGNESLACDTKNLTGQLENFANNNTNMERIDERKVTTSTNDEDTVNGNLPQVASN